MGPSESKAPKTDWWYTELEAARFWNYRLGDWFHEDQDVRNHCVVHYIEHGLREGYAAEMMRPKDGDPKPKQIITPEDYARHSQRRVVG
jgi:hypothetical protein